MTPYYLIIHELSEIRNDIYKIWPSLTPQIKKEVESNYEEFKKKIEEVERAFKCEEAGMLDEAEKLFHIIRNSKKSPYFTMLSEAALFRINEEKYNQ